MDLKTRIKESEFVGVLQTARLAFIFLLTAPFRMRSGRSAAHEEQDDDGLERTAQAFIDAHPTLAPSAFGDLAGRYMALAYFSATEAVAMLLRRHQRNSCAELRGAAHILRTDGAIHLPDGRACIPAETTLHEIVVMTHDWYIPPKEAYTWNLRKAYRLQNEFIAHVAPKDAEAFLAWLHAALLVTPTLLRGFIAEPRSDGNGVRLIATKVGSDPFIHWKVD